VLNNRKRGCLTHTGDQLTDPLTQPEREELRWYLEEYWKWPYEGFAQRGQQVEALLPQVGKRLYDAICGSREADRIVQDWLKQTRQRQQLSIVSDLPRVLSLPWELLHSERGFLVLRTQHPISLVRRLSQSERPADTTPFEPPLRVLLVTARPENAGFIDPRGIARELLDEVQEQVDRGTIAVEFLRPPTLHALRHRLGDANRPPIHLLHFDGHGAFRPDQLSADGLLLSGTGEGLLAFEDEEGKLDLVEAADLAQVLQDSGVHLVLLDACQSAMSSDEALSSVAARLIKSGVDAVVAMSASVLVTSSTRYMQAFYRELAAGTPAPIAQERARQVLHDDPRRGLVARRSSEEGTSLELRDWWLPHFYQQRPLVLQPAKSARKRKSQATAPSLSRLNKEMPAAPRYGFSGRARELLLVERHLLRGKLVVIFGFGGIGKTAMAREAADWLTRTGMYVGACFVSFEHGGDASWLLSELGRFLGIYDSTYNPADKDTALSRLKPVLKARRTLLIADNLESLLHSGEAPLKPEARTQLWNVLLDLAQLGAGVLLTSRDTAFGDGRLAPGKLVAHLALGGLSPADAYRLATRLLSDLGIDRQRASYAQLQELLCFLDYHPLAIQLVLPILRQASLAKITSDFAALLPQFQDETATGRNSSLLASLQYSLQRLRPALKALLPRLALFEGGANEAFLLDITEIPEREWSTLCLELEQVGLLTTELFYEDITFPFLHFHPVLAPYLRSLLEKDANEAALRERYSKYYYRQVHHLLDEDRYHPEPVRTLVRRELPNMQRALNMLLEDGEVDAASFMAKNISEFLMALGLRRELDKLQRQVKEAIAKKNEIQMEGAMTPAKYMRENDRGEYELTRGNIDIAYECFTQLLEYIEAQPEGTLLGRGSHEHSATLGRLARCLSASGQLTAAEKRLREGLSISERLLKEEPEVESLIRLRSLHLAELGGVLSRLGRYPEAQKAYEEVLNVAKRQVDLQSYTQLALGSLASRQRNYAEARSRYSLALHLFHTLGDPSHEATVWYELGMIARKQNEWAEAERCYRESLALRERLGDTVHNTLTYNELAFIARITGHPVEAEGWLKQALKLDADQHPNSSYQALTLSNLANLLKMEIQAGRVSVTRLHEARGYAEQSLAITELLDASEEIWKTLSILVEIAEMEGEMEVAQAYRRREREMYAAFVGNRYQIGKLEGFISTVAAAAAGNRKAKKAIEQFFPQLEDANKHFAAAIRRILTGERDWHTLVEDLDGRDALLVRRVLETLEQGGEVGA
jgi:tetratricopeptide (TPR) repeat protein